MKRPLLYAVLFLLFSHFLNNNEYIFYGRVVDAEGLAVADVRLTYTGEDEEIGSEVTGDNGSFHVSEYDATDCSGTFIAAYDFKKDGYKTFRLEREILDGEELELTIILELEDSEEDSRIGVEPDGIFN